MRRFSIFLGRIWCEISSLEVWFWIRHSEVTTTSMTSSRCSVGPTVFFSRCHSQCLWHLSPQIYLCFEWYFCSLLIHDKDQTHDNKCTSELWFVGTCWMLKHVETFTGHQTDSSSPEAVLWHRWLKAAPQRALHCGSITTQRTQQIFCQTCGKRWFCADVSSVLAALTWKEYDVSSAWTFKKPWNVGRRGCWNCSFHPTLKLRTRKGQSSLPLGCRGIFPGRNGRKK